MPTEKKFNLIVTVEQREYPFHRMFRKMQIDNKQAARMAFLCMELDKENKEVK